MVIYIDIICKLHHFHAQTNTDRTQFKSVANVSGCIGCGRQVQNAVHHKYLML